jgi:hypothetical protein
MQADDVAVDAAAADGAPADAVAPDAVAAAAANELVAAVEDAVVVAATPAPWAQGPRC